MTVIWATYETKWFYGKLKTTKPNLTSHHTHLLDTGSWFPSQVWHEELVK